MKKIILALLLCLIVVPAMAFDIISSANQDNGYFEPLVDMFATGVNSGLAAATIPGKLLTIGFQANLAVNPEEDILAQAGNQNNYIFPLFYATLHIDDFLIFGRGMAINQKGLDFWYAGGGIGYIVADYKLFFPQIRILGAYHILDSGNDANFKVATATVNVIGDYKLPIPLLNLHILGNLAYERNMLTTDWRNIVDSPDKDFGVNRIRASLGAQATIFAFINVSYEYTILPNPNHNLGVSASF
jgi:hypothetical protein